MTGFEHFSMEKLKLEFAGIRKGWLSKVAAIELRVMRIVWEQDKTK